MMSERKLVRAFAARKKGGSISIGDDDRVILERSSSSSQLRVGKTTTTPVIQIPARTPSPEPRADSIQLGPSKRPRMSPVAGPSSGSHSPLRDDDIYMFDSGSDDESDYGNTPSPADSDDEEEDLAMQARSSILCATSRMQRLVAQRLREIAILEQEYGEESINSPQTQDEQQMSERKLVRAFAARKKGGSISIGDDDRLILERSSSSSQLRVGKTKTTPVIQAPARTPSPEPRADSIQPGPSKRPSMSPVASPSSGCHSPLRDEDIYMFDSGSDDESDYGNTPSPADSDDEEEDLAMQARSSILCATSRMQRLVAQRLREIAILEQEYGEESINSPQTQDEQQVGPDYSFVWSDDFSTFSGQAEEYSRSPGPRFDVAANPLDIFLSIWDINLLTLIVQQTNEYAFRTIVALTEIGALPKYLDTWVETTVEELRRFFGILLYISLDYRVRLEEYWTTGTLEMPSFGALMSLNRFRLLLRFLHFVDNDGMTPFMSTNQKRIAKIAPIIEIINSKFSSLYTPERELSLDETLLLWKGRLSWVQCIRSKARFGIKAFELSEASTGYLLKTILYAGKDSSFVQGPLAKGRRHKPIYGLKNKTAKVVLELMDGFLDVGHAVVMDNWYNQLQLTRFLKSRNTDVIGTMNRNRVFVPEDIKKLNPKHLQCEAQVARHCGDITLIAWRDVKLVTVLSSYHGDELMVGRRAGKNITKPVAVEAYNKYMGGVDLKDLKSVLSVYLIERKRGHKWYKKVFFRLLNTSILNSFIIFKKTPSTLSFSHRAFRYNLAEALCKASRPAVIRPSLPVVEARLDGRDHFPGYTKETCTNKNKHARLRCVRCVANGQRNRSVNTLCIKCKVALCIGTCYIEYHTLEQL